MLSFVSNFRLIMLFRYELHRIPLDILSNEALHSAFPCTEIGVGGFRGASQAISEIHFVGEMRLALSFGKAGGYGCSTGRVRHARLRTSYYLPIC